MKLVVETIDAKWGVENIFHEKHTVLTQLNFRRGRFSVEVWPFIG
jgi:hypothetical protein